MKKLSAMVIFMGIMHVNNAICMESLQNPRERIRQQQKYHYRFKRRQACNLDASTQIKRDGLQRQLTVLRKKYETLHNQCEKKRGLHICKSMQCEQCIQYLNNRIILMDQISHLNNQIIILQSPSNNSIEIVTDEDFI
jgi:hypothetical protein